MSRLVFQNNRADDVSQLAVLRYNLVGQCITVNLTLGMKKVLLANILEVSMRLMLGLKQLLPAMKS
jgi:hypothetical protein